MATLTEMRSRLVEIEAEIADDTAGMSKGAERRYWYRALPGTLVYERSQLRCAIKDAEAREAKATHNWRDDRATSSQIDYIRSLMADLGHTWAAPEGLTKGAASQMIEMLKNGEHLSIGVQDERPISNPGEIY